MPRWPTIDDTITRWPCPARAEHRQRRARAVERAHEVHVHHPPHRLGRRLLDGAVIAEAGIADHDVEPAERLLRDAARAARRQARRSRPSRALPRGRRRRGSPPRPRRAGRRVGRPSRPPHPRARAARDTARPMPDDAPVMTATGPSGPYAHDTCRRVSAANCQLPAPSSQFQLPTVPSPTSNPDFNSQRLGVDRGHFIQLLASVWNWELALAVDIDPCISLLRHLVAIDSVNPSLVPGAAGEARIAQAIAAPHARASASTSSCRRSRRGGRMSSACSRDASPGRR